MKDTAHDIWYQWLLHRRHGGNQEQMERMLAYLYPIRDKVLQRAQLTNNEVLLDVGCGDGLIGFGALALNPTSHVILSDISEDLLNHVQTVAQEMNVIEHCQFVYASADDLAPISDESVDVVTTRSVLIYVDAKQQSLNEFFRVLKPGGRLSIFEPINRFERPEPPESFWGYDVGPINDLAQKVKALYQSIQPFDTDPMLNFDERDLIYWAEQAGFREIHLELQADITPSPEELAMSWEQFLHAAWNPKIPTLDEAMQQALTPDETKHFVAHLQPLVEANERVVRFAEAYLSAVKL